MKTSTVSVILAPVTRALDCDKYLIGITYLKGSIIMKKIGFIGAGNMATAIIGSLMGQNDGKADFINVF